MTEDATFTGLIQRHQAGVWRYLRALGASADEADDLTQEVFLTLLRKPIEQRSPEQTTAWLMRVAKNRLIDHRRRGNAGPMYVDMQGIDEAWLEFAGEDGGDDRVAALHQCIAELEERPRAVIQLRYAESATRNEIARRLEVDEEGAKSLLRRTLARLRKCMELRLSHEQ